MALQMIRRYRVSGLLSVWPGTVRVAQFTAGSSWKRMPMSIAVAALRVLVPLGWSLRVAGAR